MVYVGLYEHVMKSLSLKEINACTVMIFRNLFDREYQVDFLYSTEICKEILARWSMVIVKFNNIITKLLINWSRLKKY